MAMARKHPADLFNGWLHIHPDEAREAMRVKLEHRDRQIEQDKHASGEPPTFRDWSISHVRKLAAKNPAIRDQISQRREHLQEQLKRKQLELLTAVQSIENHAEQIEAELQVLSELVP